MNDTLEITIDDELIQLMAAHISDSDLRLLVGVLSGQIQLFKQRKNFKTENAEICDIRIARTARVAQLYVNELNRRRKP